MSLLYKKPEDQTLTVNVFQIDGLVTIEFESDCGKHGTQEMLCSFEYAPDELLEILKAYEDAKP